MFVSVQVAVLTTFLLFYACRGKLFRGVLETGAIIGVPENITAGSKVVVNVTDETFMSRS